MSSKLKEAKRLAQLSQQAQLNKRLSKLKTTPPKGKRKAAEADVEEVKPTKRQTKAKKEAPITGRKRKSAVEIAIEKAKKNRRGAASIPKPTGKVASSSKTKKTSPRGGRSVKKEKEKPLELKPKKEPSEKKSTSTRTKAQSSKLYPTIKDRKGVKVRQSTGGKRQLYTPVKEQFKGAVKEAEPSPTPTPLLSDDSILTPKASPKKVSASPAPSSGIKSLHTPEVEVEEAKPSKLITLWKKVKFVAVVMLLSTVLFVGCLSAIDYLSEENEALAIGAVPEMLALPSSAQSMQVSQLLEKSSTVDLGKIGLDEGSVRELKAMYYDKLTKEQQEQFLAKSLHDLSLVVYDMEKTNKLLKYGITFVGISTVCGWFLGPILL